jgi:hypothetical protein
MTSAIIFGPLRIDNTELPPVAVARQMAGHFSLVRIR